jgi:hypothetical protein
MAGLFRSRQRTSPATKAGALTGGKVSFASHSEAAGVGACPASVAVCAVLAAGGIIARPRIKDVASLTFAGASVASALLAVAFSPAEYVSKKMPVPAAAATTTDARQRREVNSSLHLPARLGLSRDALTIRGGAGSLVRGLFEAAQAVVPHPKCDCPIQVLGGALDYARRREPRLGATLRRHLRDVPQNISERGSRFALLNRQSEPDGTHSAPTYWLRERRRVPQPISLLRHIGGIKPLSQSPIPGYRFSTTRAVGEAAGTVSLATSKL